MVKFAIAHITAIGGLTYQRGSCVNLRYIVLFTSLAYLFTAGLIVVRPILVLLRKKHADNLNRSVREVMLVSFPFVDQ